MNAVLGVVIVLGILAAAPEAAACRWSGTQLECDLGASRVVIGTQTADEPTYAGSFRPQPFHGRDRILDDRGAPGVPFELQDIGADPSLCRRIGNETYCY